MHRSMTAGLAALLTLALAGGCTPADDAERPATAESRPATGASAGDDTQPAVLTDANLEAYARALGKQAEIIRRPGRGTHYGVSMSVHGSDGESEEVLEAAGMTIEEYRMVDRMVDPVFTTLNFKGEIGPPRSINLELAPEWKEKLEGDPFDTLPPESAAVLRRHMDTLVPLWSDVVGLTAQHGQ
ncbi:hypothetical protein ACOPJQ_13175 [Luteimonas dalianensis]|uniref:hypothetical protein n=1 Tax=Luteimonas dalianensis TaxID=1148196 RepID=UPI003BF3E66B